MTADEAYAEAMSLVDELGAMGIAIEIKPAKSRFDPEVVAKYSGPERVRPEKWVHVSFHPQNEEQGSAIRDRQRKLGWLGITFDAGGFVGQRDWELDWSFSVKPGSDGEWEQACDTVEDLIGKVEGQHPE